MLKKIIFQTRILEVLLLATIYVIGLSLMAIGVGLEKELKLILFFILVLTCVYVTGKLLVNEAYAIAKIIEKHKIENHEENNNANFDQNKPVTAIHEAGHALVARIKCKHFITKCVSIKCKGDYNGYVENIKPKNLGLYTKSVLYSEICMHLAGIVAESLIYKEHSAGCRSDLKEAKDVAFKMLEVYGMGKHFMYSNEEKNAEVEEILQNARREVEQIIKFYMPILLTIQTELIEKECLDRIQIEEIFEKSGI